MHMQGKVPGLVKKFSSDEGGSIKILAGVSMLTLSIFGGLAIDTAEIYRARTNFQIAVDAAALAAGRTMSRTGDQQQAAQAGTAIFNSNMANIKATNAEITFGTPVPDKPGEFNISCAGAGIAAVASMDHELWFGPLYGGVSQSASDGFTKIEADTNVKCGNDRLEIALVLDNSGSMGSRNKLPTLKSAAANLVRSLHAQMEQHPRPEPIKFSVIPFGGTVNVGTNNRNATWMDTTGISPIHWEEEFYDWDDAAPEVVKAGLGYRTSDGTSLSKFTLFDNMRQNWKGCTVAREYPYNVQDDTPSTGKPETLFVPSFSPDTPDNWTGDRAVRAVTQDVPYCIRFRWKYRVGYRCRRWSDGWRGTTHPEEGYANYWADEYQNRGVWDPNNSTTSVVYEDAGRISEKQYVNNYLRDDHNREVGKLDPREMSTTGLEESTFTRDDGTSYTITDQHKRQVWTRKYFDDSTGRHPRVERVDSRYIGVQGPNEMCTTTAITPLSPVESDITDAIGRLTANGFTNIQQGTVWGWRTLSSAEPFSEGRSESDPENRKIMIMMTDGANVYPGYDNYGSAWSRINQSRHGAFGMAINRRIFEGYTEIANPAQNTATYAKAVDSQTKQTCDNVKADGIQIYSIAFNVSSGSSAHDVLQHCASVSGGTLHYYNATDNAALVAAFADIADKIAQLSLTE